jgi:hypothetical protein
MIKTFVSLSDHGRMHVEPYLRAAWLTLRSLQREYALTMQALFAGAPGALLAAWVNALHDALSLRPLLVPLRIDGRPADSGTPDRARRERAGNR